MPGAPTTSGPSSLPAGELPAIKPGIPLGENKIEVPIIEPKLSGNALATLYRRYTGRRVIVSNAASTAEFSFVQEASPQDPLTFAEAAELLKKAATIENFVFVPHPNDPKLDVLTLATGGIRPPGIGLEIFKDDDALPEGDAVISYVMTLSYIKPVEAVNTFTQIIGQFGAYGSIAAVPNASAVVITENTSLIRKLIDLKKEIDKPSSQVASRFVKVQYADVTDIAKTLTDLLTNQSSTQKTAGVQHAPAPVMPGQPQPVAVASNVAGGNSGGSGEENPPQIVPEPRTNRIFIMGRPVDILFVEGLIREFDVPTSEKTFLRRKLHFLTVSDFLPVAGDALNRAFGSPDSSQGGAGSAGGSKTASRSQSKSNGSSSTNNSGFNRNTGSSSMGSSSSFGGSSMGGSSMGGSSSSMGGSSSSMGGGLQASNASSAPESLLVGRTLLVADNITNSIVAQGPPSALEIIERLLDQIDVKPDQVMISTVIGKLDLTNDKEFSVDYLGNSSNFAGRGGGGFAPVLPIIPIVPTAGTTPTGFAPGSLGSGSGGLQLYGKVGDMSIFLKALQNRTDFTVLSRPSIFTSNNQMGTISSGQRIAIPTGSNSYGSINGSSTQIQYQDVVLKLEVIPLVNSNREITLQISLVNDQKGTDQVIQGGAGNGQNLTVPGINTQEILTTVTIPNNETIVLGGLITSSDQKTKSGIPILSDIPLLGRLFSSTTNNKDRSELMIFMQPSIVNNARSLSNVQKDMNSRTRIAPRALKFADGSGVLPTREEYPPIEEDDFKLPPPKPSPRNAPPKAIPVEETPAYQGGK